MVARPLRRLDPRLRHLHRPPELEPGPAAGRQERDPGPGQEHRRRMGLRRIAARAVPDDDGEGLHRRPDLLQTADHVQEQIVERIPATLSLSIGAAIIWLFFGLLLGYYSALRAGGWLDRVLTVVAIAGISIPVFLIAPVLLYFLTYKLEIFPNAQYVPSDRRPLGMVPAPDPALVHAGDPLDRLLQPRPALEHARRDERGLRADGAGQGPERAAGDEQSTCCATR